MKVKEMLRRTVPDSWKVNEIMKRCLFPKDKDGWPVINEWNFLMVEYFLEGQQIETRWVKYVSTDPRYE